MLLYKFLLIISVFTLISSISIVSIDNQDPISLMQARKKTSKTLQEYLELLELYSKHAYFDPYKSEFAKLREDALELLSYNKRLSYLSMEYHCNGCQKSLAEIDLIARLKMNSLEAVMERVSIFLDDVHTARSNLYTKIEFSCEA